jgi:hypothetical protein
MSSDEERCDLIVLVADRNMRAAVLGILGRSPSLGIRNIAFDVRVHPQKDSGVLYHARSFLRPFTGKYNHALVIFDREGCGKDAHARETLENEVQRQLARVGWGDRARAIVLDPELEAWVWSDSPHVDAALGWQGQSPALRPWLMARGFLEQDTTKPDRPKEAMEAAMRHVRKRRSSSIYRELAENVSVQRCTDPAFQKFRDTLRVWFPTP